jgi:4a-hydroxytetrahydrobiopterin dehydratase
MSAEIEKIVADEHQAPEDHGTATGLAQRGCVPCRSGTPPLDSRDLAALRSQVNEWEIVSNHHLRRVFKFPDFRQALLFVNRVGELADAEGHHPDILLGWGKAEITLWTHAASGLTENDFIMAAKIDRL